MNAKSAKTPSAASEYALQDYGVCLPVVISCTLEASSARDRRTVDVPARMERAPSSSQASLPATDGAKLDTAILWCRRDLRVTDNAAMHAALQVARNVVGLAVPKVSAPSLRLAAALKVANEMVSGAVT